MTPYLKRPAIESFWRYLGQIVEVRSCSDKHVVCRPARAFEETEVPLIYPLGQFLESAERQQPELIPRFQEQGSESAQLEAP